MAHAIATESGFHGGKFVKAGQAYDDGKPVKQAPDKGKPAADKVKTRE